MQDMRKKIEARAYKIYLERGGKGGDPMGDWLRAEREIMEEENKPKKPARRKRKGEKT